MWWQQKQVKKPWYVVREKQPWKQTKSCFAEQQQQSPVRMLFGFGLTCRNYMYEQNLEGWLETWCQVDWSAPSLSHLHALPPLGITISESWSLSIEFSKEPDDLLVGSNIEFLILLSNLKFYKKDKSWFNNVNKGKRPVIYEGTYAHLPAWTEDECLGQIIFSEN